MLKRLYILTLVVIAFLATDCACHHESGDNEYESLGDVEQAEILDTIPKDTIDPRDIPVRRFYDADSVRAFMAESPDSARYRQGIIPEMVDVSVEYADRLLNSNHDYFIVVDKKTMNLGVYDKYGRLEKAYQFACAKEFGAKRTWRDGRTPEGFFAVRGKYDSTEWLFTDDDGNTSEIRGQYGPRFLRVRPMIGIHGTMSVWSLGGRVSHGCIRLDNRAICQLYDMVDVGTPIIISPGTRDQRVNEEEDNLKPMIKTGLKLTSYKDYYLPDVPEEIMEKLEKALEKNPQPAPRKTHVDSSLIAQEPLSTNNIINQ